MAQAKVVREAEVEAVAGTAAMLPEHTEVRVVSAFAPDIAHIMMCDTYSAPPLVLCPCLSSLFSPLSPFLVPDVIQELGSLGYVGIPV